MTEIKKSPRNFSIRKAVVSDAPLTAAININSWKSTYKGIVSQSFLKSLDIESRIDPAIKRIERNDMDCLIAVDVEKKRVVGFANFGPCREKNIDADAELYSIYIDDDYHGCGIGKSLFLEGFEATKRRQYKKMMVSVFSQNNNARAFYDRMGGQLVGFNQVLLEDVSYPTATYVWNLTVLF